MIKVIFKARKILMYKEVHEFSELVENRFSHPLYEFYNYCTERDTYDTTLLAFSAAIISVRCFRSLTSTSTRSSK